MSGISRTACLVTGLLLFGCGPDDASKNAQPDPEPLIPWQTTDSKGDLPNDSVYAREHDRRGYRAIAEDFAEEGFDLTVDLARLQSVWPMAEDETAVLSRFGTPILLGSRGYLHTAFDIYRSDIENSAEVLAPITGTARVYDWWGTPGYHGRPYAGVVAIWDPESHVIVQLMHVEPTAELQETGQIDVVAGEVIGTLAADLTWIDGEHLERFRHTHVDFIDGENMRVLNPAHHLPYEDEVAPSVAGAYLLDAQAQTHHALQTGQLDVVLEVSDRDDHGERNFEVGSIAFEINDDQGNVLASSQRCEFNHLIDRLDFESLETTRDESTLLLDYGSARWQTEHSSWPSSDLDFVDRTFRYALTQFFVDEEGRCHVRPDADGFIEVSDEIESIRISATVWDQNGNETVFEETLDRTEPPQPAQARIIINEVLADPGQFDANGDGVVSARDDEFVELLNIGGEAISLQGYVLRDELRDRLKFDDVTLEPGQALVVFGGGEPAPIHGVEVLVAGNLALNNDGDTVTLLDSSETVVDQMSYDSSGGRDVSLTREVDGDPESSFVPHEGAPASPGLRRDGSAF